MTNSSDVSAVPVYLGDDEVTKEFKSLMTCLPNQKGWMVSRIYQYQGFWHPPSLLQGIINFQKHFKAKDSDIILATNPKSGTTWVKALIFALINRRKFQASQDPHPLLSQNPHTLVPFLEGIYHRSTQDLPDVVADDMPSPRFFNTHIPLTSLPESVLKDSSCKIVYCCRNPKDMFVSLWHFGRTLAPQETAGYPIEEAVKLFCEGSFIGGPFWEHVLGYWKASREYPEKVMFLTYEEIKERPALQLKRIADFLGFSFTEEEEGEGVVDELVRLCSFEHLSNLEVNRKGTLPNGIETKAMFRKGENGGWRDSLSDSLADDIDRMAESKLSGHGFRFSF